MTTSSHAPITVGMSLLLLAAAAASLSAQGYGQSTAVGGGEVFVGEPLNERTPGAVYVYRRSPGGAWAEAARLVAPGAFPGDHFGRALVAAGGTLLVGATSHDDARGAVYVFEKGADGNWVADGKIQPPDLAPEDNFGRAAASDGTVGLVATWGQNEGRGAVYVLRRDPASGEWTNSAKLVASDAAPEDYFGTGLAIDGDLALIGAARKGDGKGAAYLFRFDAAAGTWNEEAKLVPERPDEQIGLGSAVALRGGRAYVGAPRFARGAGAVYVFERDAASGEWREAGRLLPFDARGFVQFGSAILFDGSDLLVGAPGSDEFQGRLYRFTRDEASGSWTGAAKVGVAELEPRERFGSVVALGERVAAAGLPGDDYGAGTAVILERGADGWRHAAKVWSEVEPLDPVAGGTVRCAEGEATLFPCRGVDLVSFLPVAALGGTRGMETNDVWGWTDPETGREYALVGLTDRTTFVDVTDAENPAVIGWLVKTEGSRGSTWRDVKVYKDHAFIVSDAAGEHGVQVFDLRQLRDARHRPVAFSEDAHYDRIHSAHNIAIDTESGFAYAVGSSMGGQTCGGGLHMIDIREPTSPTFAGCFADVNRGLNVRGYTHDTQCVVYRGPDEEHRGKQICLNANERALSIADVTDKENPVSLAVVSYPNVGYAHQGWLTEDHRYFFMDDEGDEFNNKFPGTRTLVWDLAELDDPVLVKEYYGTTFTSDHNLYVKGNRVYQSNYVSGLRVLDISDPENPAEVGYFDTVPWTEEPGFDGSWSNYPFFKSGTIVVTSGKEGVFMVKEARVVPVP